MTVASVTRRRSPRRAAGTSDAAKAASPRPRRRGHSSDALGGERSAPGRQADAVPDTRDGPREARLVYRPAAELRPHPIYLELCGPIPAIRVKQVAQQTEAICEPLSVTTDGTILDGLRRWQAAMEQHQPSLPCIEYDLTEEQALRFLIARHRTSEGLNAFCRVVLALHLEPYFRESSHRRQSVGGTSKRSSNLTNVGSVDVRADIARVAGVSTGNVSKVKQLLQTVIPDVREHLRRGDVRIHRAWQWRDLSPEQQSDALWQHRHRKGIQQTIRGLIMQHTRGRNVVPTSDQLRAVLGGLATHETAVVVADIPGNAIVVTRECYENLVRRRANGPRGGSTTQADPAHGPGRL